MTDGTDLYYKIRDVVRRRGHQESDACRVFKDWHLELRVGSGHVSVWTSEGIVFLTMSEKPVHHRPGQWEEHLSRLHIGRPVAPAPVALRELLRAQLLAENESPNTAGDQDEEEAEEANAELVTSDRGSDQGSEVLHEPSVRQEDLATP